MLLVTGAALCLARSEPAPFTQHSSPTDTLLSEV